MTWKLSTGTKDQLLGRQGASTGDGFAGIFHQCFLDVYSGSPPASPDSAATGTLLMTYSKNAADSSVAGNRLTWATPSGGALAKNGSEVWQAVGLAAASTGTVAGWCRLRSSAETSPGSTSTTLARADGLIAVSGGDLNMTDTVIVTGATHTLDVFSISFANA